MSGLLPSYYASGTEHKLVKTLLCAFSKFSVGCSVKNESLPFKQQLSLLSQTERGHSMVCLVKHESISFKHHPLLFRQTERDHRLIIPLIFTVPPQYIPPKLSTNPITIKSNLPPPTSPKMGCSPSKPTRQLNPPPPPIVRKQYRPPKPSTLPQTRQKPARPPTAAYKYQSRPVLDPRHEATYNKLTANSRSANYKGRSAPRLSTPFDQPYPGHSASWI